MEHLGLARHPDKGYWEPTQRLEHLGLDVDTEGALVALRWLLPGTRTPCESHSLSEGAASTSAVKRSRSRSSLATIQSACAVRAPLSVVDSRAPLCRRRPPKR